MGWRMVRSRLAVRALVVVGLAVQIAAVTLTPFAWAMNDADAETILCTCTHGAEATCPMHHKTTAPSSICVMQPTNERATLLTPLFSLAGPIPSVAPVPYPPATHDLPIRPSSVVAAPSVTPDPPPPRA